MAVDLSVCIPPETLTDSTDSTTGETITVSVYGFTRVVHVHLVDTVDGTYKIGDGDWITLPFGQWTRVWEYPLGVPRDLVPTEITVRSGSATADYEVRTEGETR